MPVYLNGKEFETLKEYELRITEDISNWNWKNVERYAEPVEDEEGNPIWSFFLGSSLALNYSGKYYQPWACSNVEHCEYCNGKGYVGWGMGYNVNWNVDIHRAYIKEYACPVCDCMESEEAAKDEVYFEVLEEIASEHGMSVEYDGTDVFLTWACECEDDE